MEYWSAAKYVQPITPSLQCSNTPKILGIQTPVKRFTFFWALDPFLVESYDVSFTIDAYTTFSGTFFSRAIFLQSSYSGATETLPVGSEISLTRTLP